MKQLIPGSNALLVSPNGDIFFGGRLLVPMGEISYFSTTGTTVTISGVSDGSTNMVACQPATTLNMEDEFDNGGANNGRLRYTGSVIRQFHIACTISIAPASANDVFVFGVAKNGTVLPASKVLLQATTASQARSTAMHIVTELSHNDYLELFVGNITDTDDANVLTLNLFAMGM